MYPERDGVRVFSRFSPARVPISVPILTYRSSHTRFFACDRRIMRVWSQRVSLCLPIGFPIASSSLSNVRSAMPLVAAALTRSSLCWRSNAIALAVSAYLGEFLFYYLHLFIVTVLSEFFIQYKLKISKLKYKSVKCWIGIQKENKVKQRA